MQHNLLDQHSQAGFGHTATDARHDQQPVCYSASSPSRVHSKQLPPATCSDRDSAAKSVSLPSETPRSSTPICRTRAATQFGRANRHDAVIRLRHCDHWAVPVSVSPLNCFALGIIPAQVGTPLAHSWSCKQARKHPAQYAEYGVSKTAATATRVPCSKFRLQLPHSTQNATYSHGDTDGLPSIRIRHYFLFFRERRGFIRRVNKDTSGELTHSQPI